jgi:5-methylcytosine-specific restriction endonuclease McrA
MGHLAPWLAVLVGVGFVADQVATRQRSDRRRRYRAYRRSPDWKARRAAAIETTGGKCFDCGVVPDGFEVHHVTYKRVGNEKAKDLRALCRPCHRRRHGRR